jgi:multiple sugar transport system substrate-binding protein
VLTFSGSAVGREGEIIRRQLDRFREANPSIAVALRVTPDAADQRHQLYVQWLNARSSDPDVLQLDVVWTAEFAAAGWLGRLDRFRPPVDQFFASAVAADRWNGALYALPWFIDAGMLYWRTDLVPHAPRDMDALARLAKRAQGEQRIPFGLVWQGARYEGLVRLSWSFSGAFGSTRRPARSSSTRTPRKALTFMRDAIYVDASCRPPSSRGRGTDAICAPERQCRVMRNCHMPRAAGDRAQSSVAGKLP